jgi:hypothetical protein
MRESARWIELTIKTVTNTPNASPESAKISTVRMVLVSAAISFQANQLDEADLRNGKALAAAGGD